MGKEREFGLSEVRGKAIDNFSSTQDPPNVTKCLPPFSGSRARNCGKAMNCNPKLVHSPKKTKKGINNCAPTRRISVS